MTGNLKGLGGGGGVVVGGGGVGGGGRGMGRIRRWVWVTLVKRVKRKLVL